MVKKRIASARSRNAGAASAEVVQVSLKLRDVGGQLFHDPDTRFTFRRLSDNRQIGDQIKRALTGRNVESIGS